MANGSQFNRIKPLINFIVFINKFLPRSFNKILLVLCRNIPFKVGILIRYVLLKNICKEMGNNVIVYEGVVFDAPELMIFGDNVSLNQYCYLAGDISIGNNVSIAHHCSFHSFNHTWVDENKTIRENPLYSEKINIADDIWLGCNVTVLSGVEIGGRVVVAAGTLVNKSIPNNVLFAGVPGKILKNI